MTQPVNIQATRSPEKKLVTIQGSGALEAVAIDMLKFDHTYQRDISAQTVQEMADNWDPRVAGAIVVSRRRNGELHVVDGQHRTAAAKTAGESHILALVFDDLESQKAEAGMRVKGNYRRVDNVLERFRARVVAGDPQAAAIAKICKDFDTSINTNPTQHGINAVKTVEQIFEMDGGVLLTRVFEIIQRAWGDVRDDHASVAIMRGLAWLLRNNNEKLDVNRLVDRLQAEGTDGIHRKAASHQAAWGGSYWMNWYRAVVESYNAKLAEGKRIRLVTGGRGTNRARETE